MDYLELKKDFVDKVCISTYQIHAQFAGFNDNNLTRWVKKKLLIKLRNGYYTTQCVIPAKAGIHPLSSFKIQNSKFRINLFYFYVIPAKAGIHPLSFIQNSKFRIQNSKFFLSFIQNSKFKIQHSFQV